jgi:uncharacterized protein (TIGR00255 family)
MLKSMTGFGKSVTERDGLVATVEIKTLNSKQTDIYCRLPKGISNKEIEIRNLLSAELERGKIELNLTLKKAGEKEMSMAVNRSLVKAYFTDLMESAIAIGASIDEKDAMKIALTLPNAYNNEITEEGEEEKEWELVQVAIKEALNECNEFRKREGDLLAIKFTEYVENISKYLDEAEIVETERIPAVRERMQKHIIELLSDELFDKNRFEQEMVYYVEKYDIAEEKQRLRTHLVYFIEILKNEGNGKKLNFMAQELGREINTIGSKANDSKLQHLVVNMKEELEKIKEQTANVL